MPKMSETKALVGMVIARALVISSTHLTISSCDGGQRRALGKLLIKLRKILLILIQLLSQSHKLLLKNSISGVRTQTYNFVKTFRVVLFLSFLIKTWPLKKKGLGKYCDKSFSICVTFIGK